MMTRGQLLSVARDMALEYQGQGDREVAPITQCALFAKAKAMDEFIKRVEYLEQGARPNAAAVVVNRPI